MKIILGLINRKVSWIITVIFLVAWLSTELVLSRWGDNMIPIQVAIHGYTFVPNILFMGNSRVAAGIKPSVITQVSTESLGDPIKSYNLGVGSSPFGIHYLLLKHLVQQGKQPKVLIYGFVDNELTVATFFDDPYLAQISEMADFPILFDKSLLNIDSRSDLVVQKVSRLYRYRFIIRKVLCDKFTKNQVDKSKISNSKNGFQDFHNLVRKESINQLIKDELSRYETLYSSQKNWRFTPSKTYLEAFINLAIQSKIKLIFVEMPITRLHNQMAQKSIYKKEYFEQLRRYLKNYDIPLYTLSDIESDNDIPDTMHLSDQGATSFTKILFNEVIRSYISNSSLRQAFSK